MSGITSIQSSQIFTQSANHTFNVNTGNNVKAEAASKDKEDGVTMSKDGDTVQISAQGTALAQKTFTGTSASEGEVSKDEGYTDATAAALSSAAGSDGITEQTAVKNQMSAQSSAVSGSSSGSSSTNNLSQYTDTELKQMLQDGEITQSEYNAELESRSSSTDNSDSEENLGTVTIKEQND